MIDRPNKGLGSWVTMLPGGVLLAGCLASPSPARAGDWSVQLGLSNHAGSYLNVGYAEPAYEVRARRVWVDPVYDVRRVRGYVPAVVRTRDVPVYDRWGHVSGYRVVREIVEPACYRYRTERVLVREGYYTTVSDRVLVEPAVRTRTIVGYDRPAVRVGFGYHSGHGHHYRSHGRAVRVGFGFGH